MIVNVSEAKTNLSKLIDTHILSKTRSFKNENRTGLRSLYPQDVPGIYP